MLWQLEEGGEAYFVQSIFTLPKAAFFSLLYLALKKTTTKKTCSFSFMLKVQQGLKGPFMPEIQLTIHVIHPGSALRVKFPQNEPFIEY